MSKLYYIIVVVLLMLALFTVTAGAEEADTGTNTT